MPVNDPFYENDKFAAEAEHYRAEAEKFRKETEIGELQRQMHVMSLREQRERLDWTKASDTEHKVFRLSGLIDHDHAAYAIDYMTRWSRLTPNCQMTLVINSPGGFVTEGMDLFDTILELRSAGHYIFGVGRGYVASMGAILLQACDWRVMGPGCAMLIHKPSGVAAGTVDEIADTKSWLDMTADRVLDIFTERCQGSAAAEPLTRLKLKRGWDRTDWWINSPDCLKGGLIDQIR